MLLDLLLREGMEEEKYETIIYWDAVVGDSSDLFPVVSGWHHKDKLLQLASLKIFVVLSKKIKATLQKSNSISNFN